jgi:hypothetical protein
VIPEPSTSEGPAATTRVRVPAALRPKLLTDRWLSWHGEVLADRALTLGRHMTNRLGTAGGADADPTMQVASDGEPGERYLGYCVSVDVRGARSIASNDLAAGEA